MFVVYPVVKLSSGIVCGTALCSLLHSNASSLCVTSLVCLRMSQCVMHHPMSCCELLPCAGQTDVGVY